MSLTQLWQAWDRWFFTPQPATATGLLRILVGLSIMKFAMLLCPDLLAWYGSHAVLGVDAAKKMALPPCINPLCYAPFTDDSSVVVFFIVFCIAAVLMTLGLCTRFSTFLTWLGLVSFHNRDQLNLNGGDFLLGLVCFYLVLAPAGECFSLDRIVRVWTAKDADRNANRLFLPWAQRMLQLQMALVYCHSSLSKFAGAPWLDGTAVYYVLHQTDIARFPLPFAQNNLLLSKLLTWYCLLVEGSMWTLVWIRQLRYPVLMAVIVLHIGIDYAMVLPVFETLFICSLIVFVYPEDLTKGMDWLKDFLNRDRQPIEVVFDGSDLFCCRVAETLRRVDILSRIRLIDFRQEQSVFSAQESFEPLMAKGGISLFCDDRWLTGRPALGALLRRVFRAPDAHIKKAALTAVIIMYCYCAFLVSAPRSWTWATMMYQPFEGISKFIGSYYTLNLFTPNPPRGFTHWQFEVVMDDRSTRIWTWPNSRTPILDRNLYSRYFEVLMRWENNSVLSPPLAIFIAKQCNTREHHPVLIRFVRCFKRTRSPEIAQLSPVQAETRTVVYTYRITPEQLQ